MFCIHLICFASFLQNYFRQIHADSLKRQFSKPIPSGIAFHSHDPLRVRNAFHLLLRKESQDLQGIVAAHTLSVDNGFKLVFSLLKFQLRSLGKFIYGLSREAKPIRYLMAGLYIDGLAISVPSLRLATSQELGGDSRDYAHHPEVIAGTFSITVVLAVIIVMVISSRFFKENLQI